MSTMKVLSVHFKRLAIQMFSCQLKLYFFASQGHFMPHLLKKILDNKLYLSIPGILISVDLNSKAYLR